MSAPGFSATDRLLAEASAARDLSRTLRTAGRIAAAYAALAVLLSVLLVTREDESGLVFVNPEAGDGWDSLQVTIVWHLWWILSAVIAAVAAAATLLGAMLLDRLVRLTAATVPPPASGVDHYR